MKKINALWLLLIGCLIFTACKKDDIVNEPDIKNAKGFYIINEGLFTQGNASLSFYDFAKDSVTNQVFEGINQRPLGDVFQSMTFHKGKGFLVINNSGKIEVVDSLTMKSVKTLTGFTSPVKMLFYKNKAYVTDLYSNKIQVLDANSLENIGTIDVSGSTDGIAADNGKILVAVNQSASYANNALQGLLVINPENDEIEKYVKLSEGATDIKVDVAGDIWVYCTGFWADSNATGKLHKVDGSNYTIEHTFDFGKLAYFGLPLLLNQDRNVLYYALAGDPNSFTDFNIYQLPINSTALPSTPYYLGAGHYLYGFGLDETRNELYILDAVQAGQKGNLLRVDASSKQIKKTYEVGYLPKGIVFKY